MIEKTCTKEQKQAEREAMQRLIESMQQHRTAHLTIFVQEFLARLYCDDFAPSMRRIATRISDAEFQDVLKVMAHIMKTRKKSHYVLRNGSHLWTNEIMDGLRSHRARCKSKNK